MNMEIQRELDRSIQQDNFNTELAELKSRVFDSSNDNLASIDDLLELERMKSKNFGIDNDERLQRAEGTAELLFDFLKIAQDNNLQPQTVHEWTEYRGRLFSSTKKPVKRSCPAWKICFGTSDGYDKELHLTPEGKIFASPYGYDSGWIPSSYEYKKYNTLATSLALILKNAGVKKV